MNTTDSWKKFLNPATLRGNLLAASVFITSYEIMKDSIIGQIKSFYTDGFDENGWKLSGRYETEVLDLDSRRNHLRASINWLKKNGVIEDADDQMIAELTQHRNDVAHNLPKFIADAGKDIELVRLENLVRIVTKIDRWWIVNVELPIQDEIDIEEVKVNEIISGHMVFLQLLFNSVTDSDSKFYEEFLKQTDADKTSESN